MRQPDQARISHLRPGLPRGGRDGHPPPLGYPSGDSPWPRLRPGHQMMPSSPTPAAPDTRSTAPALPAAVARPQDPALDVEVLIVGAGVSGIGTAIELLRRGQRSVVLLEAAGELGGTWRDNTYPGVAVDIPSISYSYSYETGYPWSGEFAKGGEILEYLRHCASKYGVADHVRYHARVGRCSFDAARDLWTTELEDGSAIRSRYVVSATGILSQPKYPDIPGLDEFGGKTMHTARWDHDYAIGGKRVGIIGTGASAVQVVPAIADEVEALTVFQRTPVWVGPRLDRRFDPVSPPLAQRSALLRRARRFVSEFFLEVGTFAIVNYQRLPALVGRAEGQLRRYMRRVIDDPALADQLVPKYGLGCKRPATSNRYLRAFNRDDVHLVTTGIERITPDGVVTSDGVHHALDALILATGFLTTERGNSPSFEVEGMDGLELGQYWQDARFQAYAGVSVPGFPNFFLTAGPYSGGFNWFSMLEAHVRQIMQCMDAARSRRATRLDVSPEAHARYMRHMWSRAEAAVFKDGACLAAHSYYIDRHGDASLPFPHTPWWRWVRIRVRGARDYRFGA